MNELQCSDMNNRPALASMVPFGKLPSSLGTAPAILFEGLPAIPGISLQVDGYAYTGSLNGTAVFSQVDLTNRSFVAQLTHAELDWTRSDGARFSRPLPADSAFWAVAGGLL